MATYYSPKWPTRDRVIPYRLFVLLSSSLKHLGAEDELRAAHATAFGQALSMGAKDPKTRSHTRKLVSTAFPEV